MIVADRSNDERGGLLIRALVALALALALAGACACAPQRAARPLAQPDAGPAPILLWQAETDAGSVRAYVLGSVHARPTDMASDPAIHAALDEANIVVVEIDVLAADAELVLAMLMRGQLPAGRTLADVVAPETLASVHRSLEKMDLPPRSFDAFRPAFVAMMLATLDMERHGWSFENGVDVEILRAARARGLEVRALETIDEQLDALFVDDPAVEEAILAGVLADLDAEEPSRDRLEAAYRAGDLEALADLLAESFGDDLEDYGERLIDERNRRMEERLLTLLADEDGVLLVTVGAGHLSGETGLLAALRRAGFAVTRVPPAASR